MPRRSPVPKNNTANIGFEAKLWLAADKLGSEEQPDSFRRDLRPR